jgi:hypothetical protein
MRGQRVSSTTSTLFANRLSSNCGSLDISLNYEPPRPVGEIAFALNDEHNCGAMNELLLQIMHAFYYMNDEVCPDSQFNIKTFILRKVTGYRLDSLAVLCPDRLGAHPATYPTDAGSKVTET